MQMRITFTTCLILWLVGTFCTTATAEYYRWVDKDGEIHYGDKVPVTDTKQGREKINDSGRVVETIERAKTAEEIKIAEEQQKIAELERRKSEEQAAYDRALLATFTSVEDMEHARDERVALIEQTIQLSRTRLHKQQKELARLDESRKRFLSQDLKIPPWLERNEKQVLDQIAGIVDYIRERELEKEELHSQFNQDIKRYSELTDRAITVR